MPDDDRGKDPHAVMWDYNVGLVRITSFIKSLGHSKVIALSRAAIQVDQANVPRQCQRRSWVQILDLVLFLIALPVVLSRHKVRITNCVVPTY